MSTSPAADVTQLLLAWRQGDTDALDRLLPLVYAEPPTRGSDETCMSGRSLTSGVECGVLVKPDMRAEDIRRWVEGQRAAEKAGHAVDDGRPVEPHVSWAQALSLLALLGRSVGWPVAPDEVRRREDEQAAFAWMRLRAAYGKRR